MVFDKRSIVALKKKIVNVNPFFKRFSSFWIEWWLPISIASFDAWNVLGATEEDFCHKRGGDVEKCHKNVELLYFPTAVTP